MVSAAKDEKWLSMPRGRASRCIRYSGQMPKSTFVNHPCDIVFSDFPMLMLFAPTHYSNANVALFSE